MLSEQTLRLVQGLDIVAIVGGYVTLRKRGATYECCCPFHQEKTASFKVDQRRNRWHCFGSCQEGGDGIAFIMKMENCTFIDAVKIIADKHGIAIENNTVPDDSERMAAAIRESQMIAVSQANRYFIESINTNASDACAARQYANSRFGEQFVKEFGIGYAPATRSGLHSYFISHSLSIDPLKETKLVKLSDKDGKPTDMFRGRLTIPIRDRYGRIIGFTARSIVNNDNIPKYINSAESSIFHKGDIVFGLDTAIRQARIEDKMYLVEGAVDALHMQSIGVANTVASLGGAWSENQFKTIKREVNHICFIPDADPPKDGELIGTGYGYVIKNAIKAIETGLTVSVRHIPTDEDGTKRDPDSYIVDTEFFSTIEEFDFALWYAIVTYHKDLPQPRKENLLKAIANIVASYHDPIKANIIVDELGKHVGDKSLWKAAVKVAINEKSPSTTPDNSNALSSQTIDRDIYGKYGFYIDGNCYKSIGKDGNEVIWSNFILEPKFHIKDPANAKRTFRMVNNCGGEEIIELRQDELVSLVKFKQAVESRGNFLWSSNEANMTRVKLYLYENTETAEEIVQLGWHKDGFFAFANGIFDGQWHPVDRDGLVRLDGKGNYYLPALSCIWKDSLKLYQWERKFVHLTQNDISFAEYSRRMIDVFGDNGMVGICFYLATLFRDVIYSHTRHFPILNLFGPKGSGKSQLGHCLMAFFIVKNDAPNIENTTIAALASAVEQCANALVHLDEFKNDIELKKREFLKGLWDGTGRTRMNMDGDKKKETTKVDCGVIISGQEMATADNALFSRMLFLSFANCEFTREQQARFEELKTIRQKGCTHITLELLCLREKFVANFIPCYRTVSEELAVRMEVTIVETRNMQNWAIILATFRSLMNDIDMPFTYDYLFDVVVEFIRRQNISSKNNNEIANFWKIVNYLKADTQIWERGDYHFRNVTKMKFHKQQSSTEFADITRVLVLRKSRIFMLYKKFGRMVGDAIIPEPSLVYYLEHSKGFLGYKRSFRFDNLMPNGLPVMELVDGTSRNTTTVDSAICFDYSMIAEAYDVRLESDTTNSSDEPIEDESNENGLTTDYSSTEQNELPF